ncbi:MAG: hypothetical protein IPJ71_15845 [Bdellovibrionales bacterium]|nr:hypothetical protein [Bdellovibrionales bacterium]
MRADVSFSKTGGNEYTKLYSQKSNLELEISTHQKALEALILRKNSASDAASRNQTVEEILRVHAELQASISQYNQTLKDLTYRFPEKGNESKRQYAPMKNRTIDQIEREMGIDASLSAIKEKLIRNMRLFRGQTRSYPEPQIQAESGRHLLLIARRAYKRTREFDW